MIYFADRYLHIIGQASYELPSGLIIVDDLKSEDTDTGTTTFECKIPFTSDTRSLVESCAECGNYILRDGDNGSEFYTIIDSETDTKKGTVYIYAEDAGLDLLNEISLPYAATEAHTVAWYVEHFTYDSGFEIGINEVTDLLQTLSWDDEATITERLASVATQFDCELSYSFTVDGLQLTHKYINIYKERGSDSGVTLRLNYEIDSIVTLRSIANLATALYPTGGTPEGSETAINLNGYTYDDGDIYLEGGYLKSREAVKKWSRYLNPTEPDQNYTGHILRTYTYDTTTQSVLCTQAVAELKKVCEMEINYEVNIISLPANVRIGDRVNIIDDAGEIYVSSRILKLDTSIVNQKRTATLGEYLIRDSGINQKVVDLAAAFAAKAQETAKALAVAQAAQDAAESAASEAAAAQSTADNAQTAAGAVQTDLNDNYTDTQGMTESIDFKFDQTTLTVEVGTGEDEGKLFVKVNEGGEDKQGTIDLTGLVKFTDLSMAGSTEINGANIKTGTIDAIDINGSKITGSEIISDSYNAYTLPKMILSDGMLKFYEKNSTLDLEGVFKYGFEINNGTGLAARTIYLTPTRVSPGMPGDVDILIGDPENGPNININASGIEYDGSETVDPGVRINGDLFVNGVNFENALDAKQNTLIPIAQGISSAVPVPTSISTILKSLTLPAGTYLIFANVMYAPNAAGFRGIRIHTSSSWATDYGQTINAVNGTYTSMNCMRLFTLSSSGTLYLSTYQNSGSTLNVSIATINAVRLGNV